jgi:hypothetical protein
MDARYDIKEKDAIRFYVGEKLSHENGLSISLRRIYENLPSAPVIPAFHPLSKFHYHILYARYANKISYNEYCLLEEGLARIIQQYLLDSRPIHYVFYFSDPSWFYDESILSYLTKEERTLLERVLVVNLDAAVELKNTIPFEKIIHVWDKYNHPFI